MTRYSKSLARFFLTRLLSRACESSVPRSGEEGTRVNCFVTKLHQGDDPPPVVLALEGDELVCVAWDGSRYSKDLRLPLDMATLSQFRVTHFYGLSTIWYSGLIDFAVSRLTGWPYAKIHAVRVTSRVGQYFFNKRKLATRRRMELLSFLVTRYLGGKGEFSPIDLMTNLYSLRWVEHPDGESARIQLESYLEAMVETGELKKNSYKYRVTGYALRAIEEYEEQERKHVENVRMQRAMLWLTIAIAVFTAVQAQLIKLPTLLDLSK
jgi:hypothetical protein